MKLTATTPLSLLTSSSGHACDLRNRFDRRPGTKHIRTQLVTRHLAIATALDVDASFSRRAARFQPLVNGLDTNLAAVGNGLWPTSARHRLSNRRGERRFHATN